MLRAMMLLPLGLLAGCLYLGDRNDAPSIAITSAPDHAFLGEVVKYNFSVSDDTDRTFSVAPDLRDANGAAPDPCSYRWVDNQTSNFSFAFFRPGTYTMAAVTADHRGAPAESARWSVVVTNEKPVLSNESVATLSSRSQCEGFPAGRPVVLAFSGTIVDPDSQLGAANGAGCPTLPGMSYGWRIVGAPDDSAPVLTAYVGFCVPPNSLNGPVLAVDTPLDKVCLWPAATSKSLDSYRVEFFASDQTNPEVAVESDPLAVVPDAPPCITREEPPADHFIVDRTKPKTLQVTGVDDDLDGSGDPDAQLHYQWSVWRQGDGHWYDVPHHDDSVYVVEPVEFNVGEELRVRVEVLDRNLSRGRASLVCSVDAEECVVDLCSTPVQTSPAPTCRRWTTWVLEPR
jgi:hypothetical protein